MLRCSPGSPKPSQFSDQRRLHTQSLSRPVFGGRDRMLKAGLRGGQLPCAWASPSSDSEALPSELTEWGTCGGSGLFPKVGLVEGGSGGRHGRRASRPRPRWICWRSCRWKGKLTLRKPGQEHLLQRKCSYRPAVKFRGPAGCPLAALAEIETRQQCWADRESLRGPRSHVVGNHRYLLKFRSMQRPPLVPGGPGKVVRRRPALPQPG